MMCMCDPSATRRTTGKKFFVSQRSFFVEQGGFGDVAIFGYGLPLRFASGKVDGGSGRFREGAGEGIVRYRLQRGGKI